MSTKKDPVFYGIVCKDAVEAQALGQKLRQLGANANQYQGRFLIVGPTIEELTLFGYNVKVVASEQREDCMLLALAEVGHSVSVPEGYVAPRLGLDTHTEHGNLVDALEEAKTQLARCYQLAAQAWNSCEHIQMSEAVRVIANETKPYWEARQ